MNMNLLTPKRNMKGVSELVGNVLMLLVVTGLISEAFLYGMPILQKRIDQTNVNYIEESLSEAADAMETVAREGGETKVRLEAESKFGTPPEIKITQDSLGYYIELRGATQITHYAPYDVPLNDFLDPVSDGEYVVGTLGINKGIVTTGRSTKLSGGIRNVLKIIPRPIRSPSSPVVTLIELSPARGKSTKTTLSTTMYISKEGERLESRTELDQSVTYKIITLGVGFE